MAADSLPAQVQDFLRDRLRSFEELETVRLLRAERAEWWNADAVAAKLKLPTSLADDALESLLGKGLLVARVQGGIKLYRYDSVEPALDALVAQTMASYDEDRIGVMQVMSSNAVERVRGGVIRTFADAFLVGRKNDG